MRTRCLPLNERRPQGKKAPATFEGVVRSPRRLQEKNPKKKGKRGDKVTKFLSIFNYRPICLSSPGCNKTGGKPKQKKKNEPQGNQEKSIVTNQATKIGSQLRGQKSLELGAPGQSTHINNFFPAQFFSPAASVFRTVFSHGRFWSAIKPNEIVLAK